MSSTDKHKWVFPARFRTGAYSWKASKLACQRIREAVSEIKKVARKDPVFGAEGAVRLLEKLWPALQHIDTSSGAVGSAVNKAQDALLPIIIDAPADEKTREQWLTRLWQAVEEDAVDYLSPVCDRWGEICGSVEVAGRWADELLPTLRSCWSDPWRYFRGATACLSCLLVAGRYQELLDLLELDSPPMWHYRRYGLGAALGNSYIARFRALAKRYPMKDKALILADLIASTPGEEGNWFAAAKEIGLFDLALELANRSPCDPKTLTRAARDFLDSEPAFALGCAMAALSG